MNKIVSALIMLLFAKGLLADEIYKVQPGDILRNILIEKGFPTDYVLLYPYIEETVNLNPGAFVYDDPDYLEPDTVIRLPKNPVSRIKKVAK